jgi:translation initiation factor 4A
MDEECERMIDATIGFAQSPSNLPVYTDFDGMGLHDNLLRGIYAYGLEKPSELQQRAIVPMLRPGDFIVRSPAGSGKTLLYCITVLHRLNCADSLLQAIIMVPTRELAMGTRQVFLGLGEYLAPPGSGPGQRQSFCQVLYPTGITAGGSLPPPPQAQILVGTPNRFTEYCAQRRLLPLSSLSMIVLDEADELMARGSNDPLCDFFSVVPRDQVSVTILSATMPAELVQAAKQFTRSPTYIQGKVDRRTLLGIQHFYVAVEEEYKLETLLDIFSETDPTPFVIYVNSRRKAEWLAERLPFSKVMPPELPHKSRERAAILEEFRSGHFSRLIGVLNSLPADDVGDPYVINYDFPPIPFGYFERISRGGGAWRNRTLAISFVSQVDRACVRETETFYSLSVEELPTDFVLLLQ